VLNLFWLRNYFVEVSGTSISLQSKVLQDTKILNNIRMDRYMWRISLVSRKRKKKKKKRKENH
jgi:hypothetical protein